MNVRPMRMYKRAGSLVHSKDHVLLVFQRASKKWGLPKGRCKKGESVEATAKRELYEETGLCSWELTRCSETNPYQIKVSRCIITVYKINRITHILLPIPRDTREIVEARWFPKTNIPSGNKLNSLSRRALKNFRSKNKYKLKKSTKAKYRRNLTKIVYRPIKVPCSSSNINCENEYSQ